LIISKEKETFSIASIVTPLITDKTNWFGKPWQAFRSLEMMGNRSGLTASMITSQVSKTASAMNFD